MSIDFRFAVVDNPRHAAYMIHALQAHGETIDTAENLCTVASEAGFQITPEYAAKVIEWYGALMRAWAAREQCDG